MKNLKNLSIVFLLSICTSFVLQANEKELKTSSDISVILKSDFVLSEANVADHLYDYLNIDVSTSDILDFTGNTKSFSGGFCVQRTNNVNGSVLKRCYINPEELNYKELYESINVEGIESNDGDLNISEKSVQNLVTCTRTKSNNPKNTITNYNCSFTSCKASFKTQVLDLNTKIYHSNKTNFICNFSLN